MLPTNPLLNAIAPAGPHLPTATLRQYAAGTLAPAAQHRVEAHTLACPRCADILDGLLQTPTAATNQALAQLRQRLRRRVQPPAALPTARIQPRNRWLVPQLAAAAALLFGLLAGGWWTWQQRRAGPGAITSPTAGAEAPAASKVPALALPAASSTTIPVAAGPVASGRAPVRLAAPGATQALAAANAPTTFTPAHGYSAWRARIRREATAFRPAEGKPAISGAVQLRVTVGADGKVQELRVLHGLRADYDEEAQRLVCDGLSWLPGIGGGKSAPQVVDVTVPFQ